jgi:hypothetical protein
MLLREDPSASPSEKGGNFESVIKVKGKKSTQWSTKKESQR